MHGFINERFMHNHAAAGWLGFCQNFGKESRFLVSGPDIGVMSEQRRGPLWFPGNSGAGPVSIDQTERR
ncbi:hypothetical protein Prudu_006168 [Prunus dulcis]|uniref:Uncharacterized protein n=1 Tax=Prunus dulcis TaxID=3755 RepID=A0A4Y1QZ40_PRUDU|nr:hypothetical protein Prudu_006168 [Prunus dulcis]